MEQQDIFKIAVSVIMIHLMLIFIFEGFAIGTNNPNDSVVINSWNWAVGSSGGVSSQISDAGLCLKGTASQSQCEANGCIWDSGQCYNALEDRTGVDFGFFDVILSILKIPLYLGKFILFLGSVVFFEIIMSFKIAPLITNFALSFFISITLWVYNGVLIYYLWAFISNWRGQR